jgi:hypothetical protein
MRQCKIFGGESRLDQCTPLLHAECVTASSFAAMKNYSCLRAPLAALAISVLLPACALPPRDAWRVIRHDGFLTYLAMEFGKQPLPPKLPAANPSSVARQSPPPVTVPWRASPNRYWSTNPASPVVGPPRVSPPASPVTAAVPKPVLRNLPPKAAAITPPALAKAPEKTVSPPPATAAASKPELQAKPQEPKVVAVPQAPPPAATAPSSPAKESSPAPSPAPPATPPTPAPSVPARIDDLPYGDVIAGRPGFVHSPYALKSQIVDVTGLRPGQEVKCPFTGKLFRVPPGEQAAAKPAEERK